MRRLKAGVTYFPLVFAVRVDFEMADQSRVKEASVTLKTAVITHRQS